MNRDIHVHIDRLVIDEAHLAGTSPAALSEEVRSSLAQLLADRGLTGDLEVGGTRPVLHGGVTGTTPFGPAIAHAIHAGFSGEGGKP
jgi:hypothetical protein